MPRRTADTKHPALATKLARDQVVALEKEDLASIPGWETFSVDEKRFLMAVPYYHGLYETSVQLGKDKRWYERHRADNVLFRQAIDHRRDFKVRIARAFASDLLGLAYIRLAAMLDAENPRSIQMDAIKTVLKVNGMDNEPPAGEGPKQYISSANITMNFGKVKVNPEPQPEPDVPTVEGSVG